MGRKFEVRKASMAKTQGAKTKLYSRYGKEIYMVAKGGTDPNANLSLKRVIERAKKDQVPTDVINRAIDKAKGGTGEDYETARYEGFGPGGCTVIVDCLTDNVNRSVSEVRNCFTKSESKLGVAGAVSYMYNHLGVCRFKGLDEETTLETLLMADVDVTDVEVDGDEITAYSSFEDLHKMIGAIEDALPSVDFEVSEAMWVPNDYVQITDAEHIKNFEKLMSMLEEVDDVQKVYHNAELPE